MNSKAQEDEVSNMIDKLYGEIMAGRFEYTRLKLEGIAHLSDEDREKRFKDLEYRELTLVELQKNFDQTLKTHTNYLVYLKKSGRNSTSNISDTLARLQAIQGALPSIVQSVPKN